jgi:hypothetical protein
MANGIVVQIAVISILAAISICLLFFHLQKKASREASRTTAQTTTVKVIPQTEKTASRPAKAGLIAVSTKPIEVEQPAAPPAFAMENSSASKASEVLPAPESSKQSDSFTDLSAPEGSNRRILAGISENIRRSVIKPVPSYSTVSPQETQRDPEYVRIKKRIITPHGQVRFSILKDSISVNMLAVFRRAFLDWKTPYDLIAFLPPYLEAEAEIFHDQMLLIGTAGHHEKLAIPIRSFNLDSNVLDCFDLVTNDRTASNTPAVLIVSDDEIEIVSRGVITQPVFLKPERDQSEVKFLVERYPQALQNG